ncbi:MAG: ABC transporter ATP-binding protein [Lachnospiraceae bacterium]|nr:ABC transporter ATP-binding protein [Lachnospiraceae bacterium]
MEQTIAIRTENIKRYFPSGDGNIVRALDGVSMEIPSGSLTILKGRSGSGKTTLLNLLSALDVPTEGKVEFFGKDLKHLKERQREDLRRYRMGFVFQSVALIPVMTAYENVEFALRLSGDRKPEGEEPKQRVTEILERVGLKERIYHMPYQLSGGEQQRVAIARAVAHRPQVIFADEPTGALDTASGLAVMQLFRELVEREHITVVMTTHDPNLMELGDLVYELKDGRLVK